MIPQFKGITPSSQVFQRLRLILSTYQDGSGQQHVAENKTLPGWRDFERSVAIAFHGTAQESKSIFDVIVPDTEGQGHYGISCKMRGTLNETIKKGYVSMELSNSAGQFWSVIKQHGLNEQTYRDAPSIVGKVLIDRVQQWHNDVSTESGGNVILAKSFFLTLSWNRNTEEYQLHQFKHDLPDPTNLTWSFPATKLKSSVIPGKRLIGTYNDHKLLEWYGESGGQLKYYPLTADAVWQSELFKLAPLPAHGDLQTVIMAKIQSYFPELWQQISDRE